MTSTFDLVGHPERMHPAFGFYAIFLVAGALLSLLAILAVLRRWKRAYFLAPFAPIWVAGASALFFLDARDVLAVRQLVRRGEYTTVEGCLTSFHPGLPYGTRSAAGNERWSVAGHDFDYGQGEVRPGYHLVEARGGLVHRNTRVRVSFVKSPHYGRNEIVGLQTGEGCPFAPDTSDYQ